MTQGTRTRLDPPSKSTGRTGINFLVPSDFDRLVGVVERRNWCLQVREGVADLGVSSGKTPKTWGSPKTRKTQKNGVNGLHCDFVLLISKVGLYAFFGDRGRKSGRTGS